MAFAEGWDRFDRITLRFVDPELEKSYQHADQTDGVRRARIASLVAAAVWVVVGIIGPSAVSASPATAWAIDRGTRRLASAIANEPSAVARHQGLASSVLGRGQLCGVAIALRSSSPVSEAATRAASVA
jgi:hypothetical protein